MFFGRVVRDSYNCNAEISRSVAASVYQQKRNKRNYSGIFAHLE